MRSFLIILALLMLSTHLVSQEHTNARAQWFVDSRFGMFIHWGVYSGAEGIWKGERHRHGNDYAEWIQYRNRIDKDEYLTLLDRFSWSEIDPEEWVLLAKNSGMKYVTITAKHHDGFGLWDSQVSDYDVSDFTTPKRDIIKEMADACQKHGLKLGLYYSHWVDWEHEYGWDHSKEIDGIAPIKYDQYWQEKVIPQVRELLTNYGPIGMMWFDMWKHHSETVVTKEQLLQLKSLIRELQPDCLVNSRLGLSVKEDSDVDYKTLGDNQLGNTKLNFPWQSPATVAHSWGFHSLDSQWKSTTTLLKSLINNASLNGNFMLNIGPRADGKVPFEISQRMLEMGEWLSVNGESIYGTEGFDLKKDQHDWGKISCKQSETENKLYLHVFTWPLNKQLNVTGIKTQPTKIYLMADKQKTPLTFEHNTVFTRIHLPVSQPDPYVSVVVVEYDEKPAVANGLVAKSVDNGYSLTFDNLNPVVESLDVRGPYKMRTVPRYVVVEGTRKFSWSIFVEGQQEMNCDVSYSFQGASSKSKMILRATHNSLSHKVVPTGKTVGEPKQNWVIDNFKSSRLGIIRFPEQGVYTIELEVQAAKDEQIQFQWVWMK